MIATLLSARMSSIDGTTCSKLPTIIPQAIERMKEEVHQEHPEKQLTMEYMPLDLASFQSTKDFTVAFKEKNLPLHLLINNAGLAWSPYSELRHLQDHVVREPYCFIFQLAPVYILKRDSA